MSIQSLCLPLPMAAVGEENLGVLKAFIASSDWCIIRDVVILISLKKYCSSIQVSVSFQKADIKVLLHTDEDTQS